MKAAEKFGMTEYMTPAEAAEIARCNRTHVYAALTSGELEGHQRKRRNKIKGPWLISPEALDRWIRGE
ncbi:MULTISPECIES: helix-turn-helix domain-containing protein [Rhodococcus]|uniref:helix-turn-helix domain-containing protein n=1 Tax=Rhodococcus TaxID=1827 RepID=UPI001AEF9547|nr:MULTISPECIES: helix-turn-helix domain-containing protein [Rhodococcus]QTR98402.1 helix-turn-helix domain-containing protein [Rhodococcus qingshengii]WEX03857.1 helix-turn-helix domain-containing protein [Rhodococcus sp. RCBS9]WEX03936.1 helix-turn-helix domain-containing protein [Rhodococcus sp. RCBS9]